MVVPTGVALTVFSDFDFSGSDPGDPTAPGRIAPAADREVGLDRMLTEIVDRSRERPPGGPLVGVTAPAGRAVSAGTGHNS